MLAKLPQENAGNRECIPEWLDKRKPVSDGHYHFSHLYGLFPSDILLRSEELKRAAANALKKREANAPEGFMGWSGAWQICMTARLGDGNCALKLLDKFLCRSLLPNMLTVVGDRWKPCADGEPDYSKVFQLDALMGLCTGICEMLLRSSQERIFILPALPDSLPCGTVRGLCAYGGLQVGFSWNNRQLISLTLNATKVATVRIKSCVPFPIVGLPIGWRYSDGKIIGSMSAKEQLTFHAEGIAIGETV